MKNTFISRNLAREIERNFGLIENLDHPQRVLRRRGRRKKAIEKNAQIHSYRIEHPRDGVPFNVPRNKSRKGIKQGISNIKKAFEWGSKNFDSKRFEESFIRGIAGRIIPEIFKGKIGEYRKDGTTIKGASVTPPYPYKVVAYEIPNFISSLRERLKCDKLINRIEASIYAHLHLVRIHPFVDGNGRTSRILQDIILDHYDIPIPVIETGERITYYEILDKAISDLRNKRGRGEPENIPSEGEKLFYDFIAGKVNMSLDKILTYCMNNFH